MLDISSIADSSTTINGSFEAYPWHVQAMLRDTRRLVVHDMTLDKCGCLLCPILLTVTLISSFFLLVSGHADRLTVQHTGSGVRSSMLYY